MSLRSVFSCESLEGFRPRLPLTLLGVVAVLALLETAMRTVSDDWLLPYRSRLGFFHFMEREVIPKFDSPQIVILGTSRAADAVIPKRLDELLGLPANSTVNLGLRGGRTFDALQFYRRNRATLGKARLVILNVDEWNFSSGFGIEPRYSLMAPFGERLELVQPVRMPELPGETPKAREERFARKAELLDSLRNRLLLDYTFNFRLKLRYVPDAAVKSLGMGRKSTLALDPNNQVRTSERDVGKPTVTDSQYDERVLEYYRDFDTHPVMVGHLEELARLVREDGGRFVLMQMPNRAAYQRRVQALVRPQWEQHIEVLTALAKRLDAPLYVYPQMESCGLEDTSYEDYGHMAFKGAKEFTPFLAGLIQKEGLLSTAPSASSGTGAK